ncbi:putative cytochrome-c oxidase [Helianthus anomalus]
MVLEFFFTASFCLFNSIYWLFIYSNTLYLFIISDEQSLTFDSYTIPEDDIELGQLRLLEVDNRVVVPAKSNLHIIVTSTDVLHSWAVPSSGVKCDVVPRHNMLKKRLVKTKAGNPGFPIYLYVGNLPSPTIIGILFWESRDSPHRYLRVLCGTPCPLYLATKWTSGSGYSGTAADSGDINPKPL